MGLIKLVGTAFLILIVIVGILVSLWALTADRTLSSKEALAQLTQDPVQFALLIIGVILIVLFIVFIIIESGRQQDEGAGEEEEQIGEEADEESDEEEPVKPSLSIIYPMINLQIEEPSMTTEVVDRIIVDKQKQMKRSEFRKFLKETILELEREKARIYHEVSLLDEDYRKGILTQEEFLTGIQLLLGERSLEEVFQEKDEQIRRCKARLREISGAES